jgi:hypothetical protein
MAVLFLLPWVFLLMGLLPLWMFPRLDNLYPGLLYLIAAYLLASGASLYARAPAGPQVRLSWVFGLGLMGQAMALEAGIRLVDMPQRLATLSPILGLGGATALMFALYTALLRETPQLPRLDGPLYREEGGAMNQNALYGLMPSLEAMALKHNMMLMLVKVSDDSPSAEVLKCVRKPDLVFKLNEPQLYLLVMQEGGTQATTHVFRRLKENVELEAYSALAFKGGSMKRVLDQLETELAHPTVAAHTA